MRDRTLGVFFAMLRAGLWEKEATLSTFGDIDFEKVLHIAQQQAVLGLVTAAFDHIKDYSVPKKTVLSFFQYIYVLERKNKGMNSFIEKIWRILSENGINAVLVKGQGIANCYERPLWRESGDVDVLLMPEDYDKARSIFDPMSSSIVEELGHHVQLTIDKWIVELHGNQGCGLSSSMDNYLFEIQKKTFGPGGCRFWHDGDTDIPLPEENNDVIFIFTHFLKHFYKGGLGLRQICDWSRLLWTYRSSIDAELLASRLREMELTSEWKAFASFAVKYLGMPEDAMVLYDSSSKWGRKADLILKFIIASGNFGHNRGNDYLRYPYLLRKAVSMGRRVGDVMRHVRLFPSDSFKFMGKILKNGFLASKKGI